MTIAQVDLGKFTNQLGGYSAPETTAETTAAISNLISKTIAIITLVAGAGFLFYFIFGAVNWITSGGDAQKAAAAKNTILNAVIGLIITVIAYPAILLISQLMGMPLAGSGELQILNELFK
jgi:hypothetical protein